MATLPSISWRYEYRVVESPMSAVPLPELNALGTEGWEMFQCWAAAGSYRYFFRRLLMEPAA